MDGGESTDRERHLVAVRRNGLHLANVPERCKADREIVLAAVNEIGYALYYAADELLLDSTFAPEVK
eukprot:1167849-Amphidinium_carterae.2